MDSISARIARHRLLAMIFAVILVALVMTSISMTLYVTSGASSLDLSRPGYVQARSQVKDDSVSKSFPATGELTQEQYELYQKLYDKQHATINSLGSYESGPIDDVSLRLTDQPQTNE